MNTVREPAAMQWIDQLPTDVALKIATRVLGGKKGTRRESLVQLAMSSRKQCRVAWLTLSKDINIYLEREKEWSQIFADYDITVHAEYPTDHFRALLLQPRTVGAKIGSRKAICSALCNAPYLRRLELEISARTDVSTMMDYVSNLDLEELKFSGQLWDGNKDHAVALELAHRCQLFANSNPTLKRLSWQGILMVDACFWDALEKLPSIAAVNLEGQPPEGSVSSLRRFRRTKCISVPVAVATQLDASLTAFSGKEAEHFIPEQLPYLSRCGLLEEVALEVTCTLCDYLISLFQTARGLTSISIVWIEQDGDALEPAVTNEDIDVERLLSAVLSLPNLDSFEVPNTKLTSLEAGQVLREVGPRLDLFGMFVDALSNEFYEWATDVLICTMRFAPNVTNLMLHCDDENYSVIMGFRESVRPQFSKAEATKLLRILERIYKINPSFYCHILETLVDQCIGREAQ